MEFPIQQKREECFRNQNSLLPVFLLQHKYHVHTSLPIPKKKEERPPNSALLVVRHDGKNLLLQLGKIAMESLPVNFALLTTRSVCGWSSDGAISITKHRSCLLWNYVVEHFPYPPPLISEGWSKCSIPFV